MNEIHYRSPWAHSEAVLQCRCSSGEARDVAMVTVDEFSRLVSGIYAAAAAPQRWERALRDIHRTMGGTGGALLTCGEIEERVHAP